MTIVFIVVATLCLSAWDLVPATNDVAGDTISEVLRRWGREWIVLPYIWGGLGGHFWGGYPLEVGPTETELALTFWSMWLVLILNFGLREHVREWPWWAFLAAMGVGALVFSFTWSQA